MLAIRKCNIEHGVSTNMYSLIFRVRVTSRSVNKGTLRLYV